MTTTFDRAMPVTATKLAILDRERIIAAAGFNRWLVPRSALYPSLHRHSLRLFGFLAAAVAGDWPDGLEIVPGHIHLYRTLHHNL